MRGGVDPPRQARDDRDPDPRQPAGQPLGDPRPVRRAMPRADHRDGELVPRLEPPLAVEQAGRVGDVLQRRRDTPGRRAGRCGHPAAGRAPAPPRRRIPGAPARSSRRASGRRSARRAARPALAESTRPADPNRSSKARAVCGPTPGTIVSRIRSRSSSSDRGLAHARPPCTHRHRRFRSERRQHGPDVGLAGGVGQLDAADRPRQDEADAGRRGSSCPGPSPRAAGRGRAPAPTSAGRGARAGARSDRPAPARSSPAARPGGPRRPCPTATASPC